MALAPLNFHYANPPRINFRIAYDGDALETGSIDVRDLAPALIAIADMVDYGIRLTDSTSPSVTVKVHSDFKKGSFDVGLEITQAYAQFVALFSGSHVQAWATLLSLLGFLAQACFNF